MMAMAEIILNPSGGGPTAPSKDGPRLRISEHLKLCWAVCHTMCRSFSYLATDMAALVRPLTIGTCNRNTGRGAIATVPPGDVDRFKGKASHWTSVRMPVSSPDGVMTVALLAAKFSTLTFHGRYEVLVVEFGVDLQGDVNGLEVVVC